MYLILNYIIPHVFLLARFEIEVLPYIQLLETKPVYAAHKIIESNACFKS